MIEPVHNLLMFMWWWDNKTRWDMSCMVLLGHPEFLLFPNFASNVLGLLVFVRWEYNHFFANVGKAGSTEILPLKSSWDNFSSCLSSWERDGNSRTLNHNSSAHSVKDHNDEDSVSSTSCSGALLVSDVIGRINDKSRILVRIAVQRKLRITIMRTPSLQHHVLLVVPYVMYLAEVMTWVEFWSE